METLEHLQSPPIYDILNQKVIKNHENRHQILKIHLNRIKDIIDKRNNFSILLVN